MLKLELSQLKKPPQKPLLKPLKQKTPEESLQGKRILIIGSDRSNRIILRSILTELKCSKVYQAVDGESALTLLNDKDIDLIICEWTLPKMPCLNLLKIVRDSTAWTDLPFIIIISADKGKIESAIGAKANQCVIKPYNANTLFSKIQAAFKGV